MPAPTSSMSSSNTTGTPRGFTVSSFSVGSVVELHSLQNATHWNGKTATVTRLLPDGRYAVELFSDGKQLSLKGENLQILRCEKKNCQGCNKLFPARELQNCARCGMAQYCSKACQVTDWRVRHRNDCELLRSARKAKDDEDKLPTDQSELNLCPATARNAVFGAGRLNCCGKGISNPH